MKALAQVNEKLIQKETASLVGMHVRGPARTDGRVLREAMALAQHGMAVAIVDIEQERSRPCEEMVDTIKLCHTFPLVRPFLPHLKLWGLIDVLHSHLSCTIRLIHMNADAYHAHDWMALPGCYIASRWHRKPLIFDAHELPLSELHGSRWVRWQKPLARLLARLVPQCAGVITVSPPIAEEIRRCYAPSSPVILVRNIHRYMHVAHSNRIRELLGLESDVRVALYQGNMQSDRGLDVIVRAASFLDPKRVIVLMGKVYGDTLSQLEDLIAREQVANRVKIIPPVAYADLLHWTTSADIGLILYKPEQSLNVQWCLPNKLFEYIMAGLPILATPLEAVSDILHQYQIGQIVPSLSPDAIGAAINQMLADTEVLTTMRHHALEAAQGDLCWETEQQRLLDLYAHILS